MIGRFRDKGGAGKTVPCGPDLDEHLQTIQEYADAGVDELHIQQIGGGHEAFFDAYERDILPKFAG
ncbi:hypothetical protein [Capillimicrobium parvum]|uniref:Uncharacterized protein n=1 Tax=Capillimicrobium parvum TaxID=2884022 RepID=A0A9E6Y221_9ACTN|nr:hypothetical protein [Capillimicrobium parvum]UGS38694.1 hypothetical protein DSM104329_05124 [Capillimicrobium parvum]